MSDYAKTSEFTPVKLLDVVNDWLKFAEAKNAALVALCALLIPVAKSSVNQADTFLKVYLVSAFIFTLMALFVSLLSFVPRLKPFTWTLWAQDSSPNRDVLIYFGDISRMNFDDFLNSARKNFNLSDKDLLSEEVLYQIHTNSQIATQKFRLFSLACIFLLMGVFTPLILLVILILRKNDEI